MHEMRAECAEKFGKLETTDDFFKDDIKEIKEKIEDIHKTLIPKGGNPKPKTDKNFILLKLYLPSILSTKKGKVGGGGIVTIIILYILEHWDIVSIIG